MSIEHPSQNPVKGITEGDIADFLVNTPGFFERHAELLSTVQLTSPHGHRAVSLQERQMEMLRERIKGLEFKIVEMIRNSQENVAIAERLHRFIRSILLTADAADLPGRMLATLQHEFLITQAAMRLWNLDERYGDRPYTQPASADVHSFAASLSLPYCGVNAGFEATGWLDDAATVASMAMIPLRQGDAVFGLMVLGSPDPTRYGAEMGTEFLMRVGEVASAALSRMRKVD